MFSFGEHINALLRLNYSVIVVIVFHYVFLLPIFSLSTIQLKLLQQMVAYVADCGGQVYNARTLRSDRLLGLFKVCVTTTRHIHNAQAFFAGDEM